MKSQYERALIVATSAHAGQKRKYTGDPYIIHPIGVSEIVRGVMNTDEMICAALLHDVVEDTEFTLDDIREGFGDEVHHLVKCLTDISKPSDGNRATRKAIDRKRLSESIADAQTIKIADLIHNSESIIKHDKKFAKVFIMEMRLLVNELTKANSELRLQAFRIINKYNRINNKG